MCTQVFEKIAREGRKFGLGLVLSSQRPSELSPTVLSQCNTFLLHRISNDRDQELVSKLVPDNLRGLLRELPSLPSQRAILLGWASELPVMVQMNYLNEEHRPQSSDPDYWDIWTTTAEPRKVDWGAVVHDWQEAGQVTSSLIEPLEEEDDDKTEETVAAREAEMSDYGDQLCHEQLDARAIPAQGTDNTTATFDEDDDMPF
jgi:DNA segregation ATPase FtsK/SpoIIIE-like protein